MSDMSTKNEQLEANFARAFAVKPPAETQPAATGQLGLRAGRSGDPTFFRLTLDRIRPDMDQVRKANKSPDDPETRELAESIRAIGFKNPIQVRWLPDEDIFQIIAGERRYQAAKYLGLKDVPVHLEDVDARQAKIVQLHENIHRSDLQPIEIATALQGLIADGAKPDELASLLNKSDAYVSKALSAVNGLTLEAKEKIAAVADSPIGMDHLFEVSKLPAAEQPQMVERIQSEKLTRKQLREATADDKKHRQSERQAKGGRPSKSKPFSKSFPAPNGGKITINFRKAKVETEEVIEALQHVLDSLRSSQ